MLRRIWESWKSFAGIVGNFQSRILLDLFYFIVVTPFGAAVKMFGDPLHLRKSEKQSNWVPKTHTDSRLEEARRHY